MILALLIITWGLNGASSSEVSLFTTLITHRSPLSAFPKMVLVVFLANQIGSITAGGQAVATFVARVTSSGQLLNQAQITQATQADPDSTPNNGYTNGEDDTARIELRVR